uniref:Mitochondrial calcium uniporter regulator 1 n=1 Tax=Macaca fascicularis TaxID=9541 RepID=A0A2K5U267_MACFA
RARGWTAARSAARGPSACPAIGGFCSCLRASAEDREAAKPQHAAASLRSATVWGAAPSRPGDPRLRVTCLAATPPPASALPALGRRSPAPAARGLGALAPRVCRTPAGRSGAWRCPPGLSPGVAAAAGALPQCKGPAPALVSCRRELSLSAGHLQLERRRRDFTSSGSRRLYFDTHALVCLLEDNGFATQQAEIIVSALVKILEANMDVVYKDMVTKMQQEITFQQIMSQIANVKKDMIILEKSEFSALRAENEKIKLELHQLKQQVMDEMIKVRTDTKLDFNLEKSRVKELYSLNEKKLLELRTEIVALHAQQDRALTQTDRKIETEVAGLKTMLESHKLDNIKYLAGCLLSLVFAKKKERGLCFASPSSRAQVQDHLHWLTCCFGSTHAFFPAAAP